MLVVVSKAFDAGNGFKKFSSPLKNFYIYSNFVFIIFKIKVPHNISFLSSTLNQQKSVPGNHEFLVIKINCILVHSSFVALQYR